MNEFLEYEIIHFGKYALHVHNLLGLLLLVITAKFLLSLGSRGIQRHKNIDAGAKYSIRQLFRYIIIVITILLGISVLGFNLSSLFIGSAALLVGIGFGLQHLFNDFISGIILLFDGTIKVNDVIEVENIVCRVHEIKLRTTTVITREDKFIILPNSILTQGKVVNWTYSLVTSRFEIQVPLAYDVDVNAVLKLLKKVTQEHKAVDQKTEPSIRITKFADSSIEFTVMFWCSEVFRVENIKSELRIAIFTALRDQSIHIPFPQRVLHYALPGDSEEKKI
jgi:small-conductance mechanosensitive channel